MGVGGTKDRIGVPVRPVVTAPSKQPYVVVLAFDDKSVAVVLELVHPQRAVRNLVGGRRDAWLYEAETELRLNRPHAAISARKRASPLLPSRVASVIDS